MISEFFADGMIPWSPILLSLKVAGLATAASFCAGVAAAWLLARRRSPFSAVLDAMCTLPMILPPTVLGYYLILLVGRRGVIGPWLAECGINLIFFMAGSRGCGYGGRVSVDLQVGPRRAGAGGPAS